MAATDAKTNDSNATIEVKNLRKMYGSFCALDGVSFSIKPGEIVGFLGPNGAGKTTTMKILTCFMSATSGEAFVAGHNVRTDSDEVRRRIGYLPENVPLYEEMLVYDYLNFIAEIRGIPKNKRHDAIKRTVRMTGLEVKISNSINELSKGYRQRVGLAQAIIHEPDVVILDEPTTGLDPNQILEIRDVIKTIGAEKTVMFSTHIMQEVAAVCDRVIIINQGEIVADDTVSALSSQLAQQRPGLLVTLRAEGTTRSQAISHIKALKHVQSAQFEPQRDSNELGIRVQTKKPDDVQRQIFALAAEGDLPLRRVGPYEPNLEEIFRTFTRGVTEESADGSSSLESEDEDSHANSDEEA